MQAFIIIFILFAISDCSVRSNEGAEPHRINGIPEKAFWIGGTTGGNWFSVERIHDHRNSAIIKVYDDQNGSLIVSKRFYLICREGNQVLIGNLREQINLFDGERILLKSRNEKENCWLQ